VETRNGGVNPPLQQIEPLTNQRPGLLGRIKSRYDEGVLGLDLFLERVAGQKNFSSEWLHRQPACICVGRHYAAR